MCLYAFEFSRSQSEFTDFFQKFFTHIQNNQNVLASNDLSLEGISNASIALVQFGMTTDDYITVWNAIRAGVINKLQVSNSVPGRGDSLENTTKSIEMILGALTVVDG